MRVFGARAQRIGGDGNRAEESRLGIAHVLCADPSARHRKHAIPLDHAALPLRLPARLRDRDVHSHAAKPGPEVTPLGTLLRERIAHSGPMPFREFMDAALYHPVYG